jgi:hypothetical protein
MANEAFAATQNAVLEIDNDLGGPDGVIDPGDVVTLLGGFLKELVRGLPRRVNFVGNPNLCRLRDSRCPS